MKTLFIVWFLLPLTIIASDTCKLKDIIARAGNGIDAIKSLCLFQNEEVIQVPLNLQDSGSNGIAGAMLSRHSGIAKSWIYNFGRGLPFFETKNSRTILLFPFVLAICRDENNVDDRPHAIALTNNGAQQCGNLRRRTVEQCTHTENNLNAETCTALYRSLENLVQRKENKVTSADRFLLISFHIKTLQLNNINLWWTTAAPPPPPPPAAGAAAAAAAAAADASGDTLTFHKGSSASYGTNDEFDAKFARLFAHSSQGNHFVDQARRQSASKMLGESIQRGGNDNAANVLDKKNKRYVYRNVVQSINNFMVGALKNAAPPGASDDDKKIARSNVLTEFITSKMFTKDFEPLKLDPKKWKDFSLAQGGTTYNFLDHLGKNEYNLLRKLSRIPSDLKYIYPSLFWLPTYSRMLKWSKENLFKGYDMYQTFAHFNGIVLHGAGLSFSHRPTQILTDKLSLKTFKKYHTQTEVKNVIVLQNVRFRSLDDNLEDIPQPSELDYNTANIRKWLCAHTTLRTLTILCGSADDDDDDDDERMPLAFTKISASEPLGATDIAGGVNSLVDEDANNDRPDSDFVVVLEVYAELFSELKSMESGNAGLEPRGSDVHRDAVALQQFRPRLLLDYVLICDIDATHVAVRADVLKGQASYTNVFCYSGGLTNGVHKLQKYASVVSIFPGDDRLIYFKRYADNVQWRTRFRFASTAVIYDLDMRPWFLNIKFVVDSKCGASMCGGGAGNAKCAFVPNHSDCRCDTISVTDVNKLSEPFKWEDEVCSASRFYELDNLLRQCERTIRVNLGVEVFLEQFHLCKTSLSSPGATVQDKQQACKHVRLAGRPYKKINGDKGGAGASGLHKKKTRLFTPLNHPEGDELRRRLTAAFWCRSVVIPTQPGVLPPPTQPPTQPAAAEEEDEHDQELGGEGGEEPQDVNIIPQVLANQCPNPDSVSTQKWPEPPLCKAELQLAGVPAGTLDGWESWIPPVNSPLLANIDKAVLDYLKSETSLSSFLEVLTLSPGQFEAYDLVNKLRKNALQVCQRRPEVHASTIANFEQRVAIATTAFNAADTLYKAANALDPKSLDALNKHSVRQKFRLFKEEQERLLKRVKGPAHPVSVCALFNLLKRDVDNPQCTTLNGVIATALYTAAKNVCDIEVDSITKQADISGDGSAAGYLRLRKGVDRAALSAFNAFKKTTKEEFARLNGQHWFGDLSFLNPGECAITDALHAFFRAVGSMTTVLLQVIQMFVAHCGWQDGTATRLSIFIKHIKKMTGANVGEATFGDHFIIKRANSNVFFKLLYEADWSIGFVIAARNKETVVQEFCKYEEQVKNSWHAVQQYVGALYYYHQLAVDPVAEFGFTDKPQADLWLQTSTKNLYLLLEKMRPPDTILKGTPRERMYSPYGTRSTIYINHQLIKQSKAGILHSRLSTDVPERMQRLVRRGADNAFRGRTAQGESPPDQILRKLDARAALQRLVDDDEATIRTNLRRHLNQQIVLKVDKMKAKIDALNLKSVLDFLTVDFVPSSSELIAEQGNFLDGEEEENVNMGAGAGMDNQQAAPAGDGGEDGAAGAEVTEQDAQQAQVEQAAEQNQEEEENQARLAEEEERDRREWEDGYEGYDV